MADPSAGNFTVAQLRASSATTNNNATSSQPAASEAAAPPREEGPTFQQKVWDFFFNSTCINVRCVQRRILESYLWRTAMSLFSVVLLFGSQIHHLWLPPRADLPMDIVYALSFLFFLSDIGLRVYAEPNYFQFQFGKCWGRMRNPEAGSRRCVLGSFMFWCDLISMMMLLYDISIINQANYEMPDIGIVLGASGGPTSGIEHNRLRPVRLEVDLLVTIGRTFRVARFVRSRTVAKTSSRINWYWLFHNSHLFNPIWWWKTVREQRQKAHSERMGVDSGHPDDSKRPSWGVLQLGILAALKAQAEAEAQEAKQRSSPGQKRFIESVKKTLRSMGILKDQVREIRRQIAATKIQRAWRAHVRYDPASHDGSQDGSGEDGVGTGGGSDAFSLRPRTKKEAVGKALHKRSVMRQYAKINTRHGGKSNHIRDPSIGRSESRFHAQEGRGGRDSQVGSDMRELTGQRVAMGVLLALLFTVVFTYSEANSTRPTAMIMLHEQTRSQTFQLKAFFAARNTSVPFLYKYQPANSPVLDYPLKNENYHEDRLRDRERMRITVTDSNNDTTVGWFALRFERRQAAWVQFVATVFVFLVWFFGVNAFAGPVMSLVVIPIERMVRLLGMIMVDPLGYQKNARFKKFLIEEDVQYRNTRWTKEVLKGMETHFLMSTILRIGSLMRVGFGSAGVEIIRNNLQRGQGKGKNTLILNSQGSTVACIFLFCDIRQFTDATECLQEEVFVFTNRIASVVHSICNSYGGAANKNVGDAFLMSWLLDDEPAKMSSTRSGQHIPFGSDDTNSLKAKNNQADKALYSVIKICIALYYDRFYIETMTDGARTRLLNKIKNRPGPVVQMGFGLHAGKAVQGAIGSQRKIDATYVSEAVERSEFLESSTKQYGLKMLMSDKFHRLLHANTRRRCRKIDQLLLQEGEDEDEDGEMNGEIMELYTFDMDIEAIRKPHPKGKKLGDPDAMSDTESDNARTRGGRRLDRRVHGSSRQIRRRRSVQVRGGTSEELQTNNSNSHGGDTHGASPSIGVPSVSSDKGDDNVSNNNNNTGHGPGEQLVLPTGLALYSLNVWQTPDMKRIRLKYVESLFFQKFNSGLQAFYKKDWDTAKQCFETVLDTFDDGPSKYFMAQMKKYDGVPPRDFLGYGIA